MKNKKIFIPAIIALAVALLGPAILNTAEAAQAGNPVLEGRNVRFSEEWLTQVIGKHMTQAQFQDWKNKLDRVYDSYVNLTGGRHDSRPDTKMYISLSASFNIPVNMRGTGSERGIVINPNNQQFVHMMNDIAKNRSWDYTTMHEMAHGFGGVRISTSFVDKETFADLLVSYAMETLNAEYGSPGGGGIKKTVGAQHRQAGYAAAINKYKSGNINAFSSSSIDPSAFRLYTHGLVDKVGWGAYQQAIRSYKTTPSQGRTQAGAAGEFLHRVAGGRENVLRSFPDNGRLLYQHFNVQTQGYTPQQLESVQMRLRLNEERKTSVPPPGKNMPSRMPGEGKPDASGSGGRRNEGERIR